MTTQDQINTHTISVLVDNEAGVLARVISLFSGRGYNIDSLVVGRTEIPELSRITIVVVDSADSFHHVGENDNV